MIRRGLVASPQDAAGAVSAGRVTVAGRTVDNPASLVASDEPIHVLGPPPTYASRGGLKLSAALARFGLDPADRRCLDAGASTGGFTDVLLAAGAASVVAVDVGYGQLSWRLRRDPRVTVMERTNVRDLRAGDLAGPVDLITADLSFVSLAAVVPVLVSLGGEGADLVLLLKPQFEAPRDQVERGGVVTDLIEMYDRAGAARRLSVSAAPLRDATGATRAVVQISRDVTDLHAAIAERARLDGALLTARRVAHDLNNRLGVITAYGDMLFEHADGDVAEVARAMSDSAEQAGAVVRRLLSIVRVAETDLGFGVPVLDLAASS
jgi:23S rRNA (cytidine1920-2'-O)/16S rRNA (cytidine1409-2'-O)-methyltransferase